MNPDPLSPNSDDEPKPPSYERLPDDSSSPNSSRPERDPGIHPPDGDLDSAGEELADGLAADPDSWKAALRRDFEEWLESLDDIPPADDTFEPADAPDLCSFYELLAAGNTESRKANRRTAEAFSQWGDTLGRFDQELRIFRDQLGRLAADQQKDASLSRSHALVLIELFDRLERLAKAFQTPPPKSWWSQDRAWRKTWEIQSKACDILTSHFQEFLAGEGIARLAVLNQPFNPAIMSAAAAEPDAARPHHTVVEEIAAGYRHHGELLRPAQVKVTLNKTDSNPS